MSSCRRRRDDAGTVSTAVLAAVPRRPRWPAWLATGASVALAAAVAAFEFVGWPFLAEPIQQWLSSSLDRRVSFAVDGSTLPSVRVRLLGRLRIEAPQAVIAAPAWSRAPAMLHARDVAMTIGYADLWRAHRGQPLRIRRLQAAELDAVFERLRDGRASWLFGRIVRPAGADFFEAPLFEQLVVGSGTLRYRDDRERTQLDARFTPVGEGVQVDVDGRWGDAPLRAVLRSDGPLPWVDRAPDAPRHPLTLHASVDGGRLSIDGRAADVLHLAGLTGRVEAAGDSVTTLAAALGLPLPGRAAFVAGGAFAREGPGWRLSLDRFAIGSSELQATLALDRSGPRARLTGRLVGRRLMWGDLAPTPPWLAAALARGTLPSGPHDVPALRGLDAEVDVDLEQADFMHPGRPPAPLAARWILSDGRVHWLAAQPQAR